MCSQDTLRSDCNNDENCVKNCCVSHIIAPIYFVVFVLMAQFVLVNVVVAVLMKPLEVSVGPLLNGQCKGWGVRGYCESKLYFTIVSKK
jgi:hypothetical protein